MCAPARRQCGANACVAVGARRAKQHTQKIHRPPNSAAPPITQVVARTLAQLDALLAHAPVLAAVCGSAEDASAGAAEEFATQDPCADQQTVPPAAAAFILRALGALVDGVEAKARAAKTKVRRNGRDGGAMRR